jgi:hypothetical protein
LLKLEPHFGFRSGLAETKTDPCVDDDRRYSGTAWPKPHVENGLMTLVPFLILQLAVTPQQHGERERQWTEFVMDRLQQSPEP